MDHNIDNSKKKDCSYEFINKLIEKNRINEALECIEKYKLEKEFSVRALIYKLINGNCIKHALSWAEKYKLEKESLFSGNYSHPLYKRISMDAYGIYHISTFMPHGKIKHPSAYLTLTSASGVKQHTQVTESATFFGSDPKCQYKLKACFISKRHVLLLREIGGFALIHLGNCYPPKVNGIKIDHQKLNHGDIIEIGKLQLTFNIGVC